VLNYRRDLEGVKNKIPFLLRRRTTDNDECYGFTWIRAGVDPSQFVAWFISRHICPKKNPMKQLGKRSRKKSLNIVAIERRIEQTTRRVPPKGSGAYGQLLAIDINITYSHN
jgi:hypothetical protein